MDGGGRAKHGARAEGFSGTFWLGPPRLTSRVTTSKAWPAFGKRFA